MNNNTNTMVIAKFCNIIKEWELFEVVKGSMEVFPTKDYEIVVFKDLHGDSVTGRAQDFMFL